MICFVEACIHFGILVRFFFVFVQFWYKTSYVNSCIESKLLSMVVDGFDDHRRHVCRRCIIEFIDNHYSTGPLNRQPRGSTTEYKK